MNVAFSFMPLLLFAGLFFLVIRGSQMKKFSLKITYWILFIYIGLLVTSMLVVTIFIEQNDISDKPKEDMEDFFLYGKVLQGDVEKLENYVITEKTLDYDKKELYIDVLSPNGNSSSIFVDRKPEYADEIKVTVYGYVHLYGVYFTDKLNPYNVQFIGDNLVIEKPSDQIFKIASQKDEFTINQFREGSNDFFKGISFDDGVILITVPVDVTVKASERIYIEEIRSN